MQWIRPHKGTTQRVFEKSNLKSILKSFVLSVLKGSRIASGFIHSKTGKKKPLLDCMERAGACDTSRYQ